ncbi:alpha/beta hydrolase family protein [Flavobacteriaceae bacterium M23B6Z8]
MRFNFATKRIVRSLLVIVTLVIVFIGGMYVRHEDDIWLGLKEPLKKLYQWSSFGKTTWNSAFEKVDIDLSNGAIQYAYFYSSSSSSKRPLLVSLHTWGGDYKEYDPLANLAYDQNLNYIHPDFYGPNNKPEACCSDQVIKAIDAAIAYAIKNGNVDPGEIYITGASGGGYATLCMLLKSTHKIKSFAAWVPVTDLEAWYYENKIRKGNFTNDILACTSSGKTINRVNAAKRSPLQWQTNSHNLENANIAIYAGIYDGITGSVPITHAINFYNKLLKDRGVPESAPEYVNDYEKSYLLEKRIPLHDLGSISGRKVCLRKTYENITLVIFEGGHEMLAEYNLKTLMN